MPLFPLLFVVFLVLKLTHVIDWSWWLVSAPLTVPLALWALFMGLASVLSVIGAIILKKGSRK